MSADLTSLIAEHRPSRWRSFSNDNTIIRCAACKTDFGNATRKAKRGDDERAWAEYDAHLAAVIESSDWLAEHDREVAAGAVEARADDVAYEVRRFEVGSPEDAGYYDAHMEIQKKFRDRAQAIREGRA